MGDEGTTNKWSVDPIQVPIGPVTRARAKRFKETLNLLIQGIWAEESSWRSKGDAKSVLQDWVFVVQAVEGESLARDRRTTNFAEPVDRILKFQSTELSRNSTP